MSIEAGIAERPYEGKGHDRLVLFEDLGRFAVFDGAGQAIASSLAAKVFREQHEGDTVPPLKEVFERVQAGLMNYQDHLSEDYKYLRGLILTTGTAVGINPDEETFDFAQAGDSAMYMFDFGSDELTGVTRQEVIGPYPDIANFLGSPEHILSQYGKVPLPEHSAFVLFSDGVGDKANPEGAVTEATMADILGSDGTPVQKAEEILDASSINDDRAVIVIEHQA